jgi:hypothetical protein
LGRRELRDVGHAIVDAGVRHAEPGELLAQPLSAVDTDLHGEGQPGLQTHMHQPEIAIGKIEVQVTAFPFFDRDVQPTRRAIGPNGDGSAGLDGAQNTNQPVGDPISLLDRAGTVLFRDPRRQQVLHGTLRVSRQLRSVRLEAGRQGLGVVGKVFQQHMPTAQPDLGTFRVTDRSQRAPKQHAVKSC